MVKLEKKQFIRLIILTVVLTLVVGAVGFFLIGKITGRKWVDGKEYDEAMTISTKYAKLYELQNTIDTEGYWDVSEDKQMNAVYKGLVKSLDDKYSEYQTAKEAKAFKNYVNSTFYGIGVIYQEQDEGQYVIDRVIKDSPASAAGIKKGDIITKVDGKERSSSKKLREAIAGKEGTNVEITFLRDGVEKTVTCVRGEVNDSTVNGAMLKNKIGYIRISSFAENTADEFESELAALTKKHPKGLIIDIRANTGGYAAQSVKIADMLLPECTIMTTKTRQGDEQVFNSDENCTKLKYVLLVDENSASASEILAAAIKENKGGALVGQTTFGKGIMQHEYNFKDGSALKLTVAQYFSPNGNVIHKKGVKPDYKVKYKVDGDTDTQYERAVELLLK